MHPKRCSTTTLYAIDQFVMRGGRALIFVDPIAEILAGRNRSRAGSPRTPSSNLDSLFKAWGVEFSSERRRRRQPLCARHPARPTPVRHVGLLGLDMDAMSKQDVITSGLGTVNLGLAGYFKAAEGATSKLTPLLQSSTEAERCPPTLSVLARPGRAA